MSIINFPYRWHWSTIGKNLSYAWGDFIGGVQNLYKWAPVIWEDRWYDADYLLRIMEFKLRGMADRFDRYGYGIDNERYARDMRICAALCRRMQEDNYGFDEEGDFKLYFENNKTWLRAKSRDAQYLGRILGKYLPSWWD